MSNPFESYEQKFEHYLDLGYLDIDGGLDRPRSKNNILPDDDERVMLSIPQITLTLWDTDHREKGMLEATSKRIIFNGPQKHLSIDYGRISMLDEGTRGTNIILKHQKGEYCSFAIGDDRFIETVDGYDCRVHFDDYYLCRALKGLHRRVWASYHQDFNRGATLG